ncbi:hypothetical protein Cgig2_007493 [Carnegiea gigantea]|uniref:DUF4283 domain-containing protein n=1 Tax=Carnegiea gigantea TaxID=171969 RepID=A0A9Q1GHH7_9CARY|nr:hypothetical protein Cgig2_007493 [Carnegiea gigantea]
MVQELSTMGNVVMSEQRMEEPKISTPRVSTYAAMVDPHEGTQLSYVLAMITDGIRYARIEKQDVAFQVEYWSTAILCGVMGANPPLEVMEGFIRQIWRDLSITKIALVRKGLFLVRFEKEQDKLQVTQRGIYIFDSKPFVFLELDICYWGTDSLSKLGSLIGIPIKTDKYTKNKDYLHYARMLIEVPMEGPFLDTINFINDSGVLVKQRITFEWKPVKCNQCQQIGHEGKECRNKGKNGGWLTD